MNNPTSSSCTTSVSKANTTHYHAALAAAKSKIENIEDIFSPDVDSETRAEMFNEMGEEVSDALGSCSLAPPHTYTSHHNTTQHNKTQHTGTNTNTNRGRSLSRNLLGPRLTLEPSEFSGNFNL